ncbi:MAG: DUF47 family protein [Alphaproteobacteria bacterium]|nr:DUF47 family protein [Alphaproteobacteria bacterium]
MSKIKSWLKFFRLMPREEIFFTLLRSLAVQAQESATHLKTLIETQEPQARQYARAAMAESRAKAKSLSIEITQRLSQTFITPFDREDIEDLASDLYRIPKLIDRVCDRLALSGLEPRADDFARQVDLIVQEAAAMKAMVRALTTGSGNSEIIKNVNILRDLEHEGDRVLNDLLEKLFRETHEVRDLILRKDIYDMLEKVIDRYRDAAGVALQIVLKHS